MKKVIVGGLIGATLISGGVKASKTYQAKQERTRIELVTKLKKNGLNQKSAIIAKAYKLNPEKQNDAILMRVIEGMAQKNNIEPANLMLTIESNRRFIENYNFTNFGIESIRHPSNKDRARMERIVEVMKTYNSLPTQTKMELYKLTKQKGSFRELKNYTTKKK